MSEPAAPQENDRIGDLTWSEREEDGSFVPRVGIHAVADADWTPTEQPTRYEFWTRESSTDAATIQVTFSPVGWAYWLDDHWHLCADEPVAHERRERVYVMSEGKEKFGARGD